MVEPVSLWLILLLAPVCLVIAATYGSVGLGGGSGYLAVMTLFGISSTVMPSTALTLNIVVTGTVMIRYGIAGRFRPGLFLPFVLAAVPCAFLGGMLEIAEGLFFGLLAVALVIVAVITFRTAGRSEPPVVKGALWLRWAIGLPAGAAIGLASGALGIGGGIFLGPLVLLLRWAGPREVAAMTSAYIFVLSASGLAAHGLRGAVDPPLLAALGVAVLIGGAIGAHLGETRLSPRVLRRILACVLLVAAIKAGMSAFGA
jgi:uncharacterized membrane protein YfcA